MFQLHYFFFKCSVIYLFFFSLCFPEVIRQSVTEGDRVLNANYRYLHRPLYSQTRRPCAVSQASSSVGRWQLARGRFFLLWGLLRGTGRHTPCRAELTQMKSVQTQARPVQKGNPAESEGLVWFFPRPSLWEKSSIWSPVPPPGVTQLNTEFCILWLSTHYS